MRFVRPFAESETFDTGYPGYRAQYLSNLESALLLASHIDEGGCGPRLHYHHSDQLYYLMTGSMTVQLGDATHEITAGTGVYIPAGLAHCNSNPGPGPETHFEIIVPSPAPGAQIAIPVGSPDEVPQERRASSTGYVRRVEPHLLTEPMPGFRIQPLADPGLGAPGTVVNYSEVDAGHGGPGTHVHDFDQYYLVLEGELTVEVALEKHVVGPNNLVLLPAGVPHRQYNAGTVTEKHLAVLAPAPILGQPWDRGVTLATNGEDHAGTFSAPTPAEAPA